MYSIAPATIVRSTTPPPTPIRAFSTLCMQNDKAHNELFQDQYQDQDQYSNNAPESQEQDLDQHAILVPQGQQFAQEGKEIEEEEAYEDEDEGGRRRSRQRVSQEQQQQLQVETRESAQGVAHNQQTGVSSVQQNQQGEEEDQGQGQVLRGQQAAIAGGSNACDIEDRMSACMNPNQINGGQEEVEQQQQPQAFHYYPPFPPMVGTLQYPFILQQMFNPQNLDVVLGVPVPPWIINPTPSSPSDTAEQPAPHNQPQQNADVDLTPSQNNVQNEPGENLGGCGNTGDENP